MIESSQCKNLKLIFSCTIEEVDKQLEDLDRQRKLLEPRRDFTSDLQETGRDGAVDIREDYDEEKERIWKGYFPLPYKISVLTIQRKRPFENKVGKEENADHQHFLLFPQCFPKVSNVKFDF